MGINKKNKRALIIAVLIIAVILSGSAWWLFKSDEAKGFYTITPQEAVKLIKTQKNLMIIDVRGSDELREGWVEGSVFMPLPEILNGNMVPPKDRPILLVCAVGGRSLGLGKAMINYGWTEVYNLEGGIGQWKAEGLPLKFF